MADPLLYEASNLEAGDYADPLLKPSHVQWASTKTQERGREALSTLATHLDKVGNSTYAPDIRTFVTTGGASRGYQYTPWQMRKFAAEIRPADLWKVDQVRARGPHWVVHLRYLYETYSKDGINALLRDGRVQFESTYSQSTAYEGRDMHRAGRARIRDPAGRDGNHLVQFFYTNYITAPSWSNKKVGQLNAALQRVKTSGHASMGASRAYDLNEAGDLYSNPEYTGLESDLVPYAQ